MSPPADSTLIIRHQPGSAPARFQLLRADGKGAEPAELPSPFAFPVESRPESNLMRELQWYLETFLEYPYPPNTDRAERIKKSLREWGRKAFDGLFASRSSGRMFEAATGDDYARLRLEIASDDARILAWPWEALYDHEIGTFLAHACHIERRLDGIRDPRPIPERLPRDRVNILLVVARPFERDVGFRSIARPLVELIEKRNLPAKVDLLRPPTLDQLRDHLRRRPGYYHILHFDGHGAYRPTATASHQYGSSEGLLVFEDQEGKPARVSADDLNVLLRDFAVPAVVLNACQSAMLDEEAEDAFASVATALLRSGVRSVVAMAYSLYVSGAQQFLPEFYGRLFDSGDLAAATRAGRQQMRAHPGRVCARGEFPLEDWLLPVLYQQKALDFSFASQAKAAPRESSLPEEVTGERNPYGFIGRDSALLAIERAMYRPPPAILIEGLGGVGKTTLARGFLRWLEQTQGLGEGAFWFSFQDIRSAEYVFNRLGEPLFGGQFGALPVARKIELLAKVFREKKFVTVWDNFEVAKGIPNTPVTANLSEEDRGLLAGFLDQLRGGASKVLITSRSPEDWLGPQRRFKLPLGGLDGEERWEFCAAVLRDLGKTIERDDEHLAKLMDLLGGHPLAMRVILPRLEKVSAAQVLSELQSNLAGLAAEGDEAQQKLYATLQFVEKALPEDLRELLLPLGMHETFVDADYLEVMAQAVDKQWTRARIDGLMGALGAAGLLQDVGQAMYRMHPLLTSFLRATALPGAAVDRRDAWARAFVDFMGRFADRLAPKELHEQRFPFHVHGANFHYALGEAERLEMDAGFAALTQALAAHAQNTRDFTEAAKLFQGLAGHHESRKNPEGEAGAYHQLGMIAQEQRDFAAAEQWYRKSLAIKEKQGNEHGAASSYHQLGRIAEEQRDFAAAEQWYRKSLAIKEKQGNEHGAAPSPITNWGGSPKSNGISRRRSSGIANPWRSRKSRATSTAPPSPITNWGGSPKSNGISRRRSSGIANPWRSTKSRATSTAPPAPITNWGGSPKSNGISRRPSSGIANPWRSRKSRPTSTTLRAPTVNWASWPGFRATSRKRGGG